MDRFEVIVVDDASSDNTLDFLAVEHPDIRVVPLSTNRGLAAACNAGAAVARGEVLVMLNNDTEAEPGWLAALVDALLAHPEAGAAASKMLLFDRRDTLHTAGDLMGIDGVPRNRGVWERDEGQYDDQVEVFSGCGGAVAYWRTVWDALGGFDEDLFMYLEDVDLAWRMQLAGWKTVFAPASRVYHRLSATGGGPLASFYTGRNTIWVIAKNMPGKLLRRYWWVILKTQLHIGWDALRAWRGAAARARLRGQIAGLLGLPRMLRKRQAVQRARQVDDEAIAARLVHSVRATRRHW